MKKVILVVVSLVILITVLLPVLSTPRDSFIKKTKDYEVKIEDNIVKVVKLTDNEKAGYYMYTSWPWIPLLQFEKYRNDFIEVESNEIRIIKENTRK